MKAVIGKLWDSCEKRHYLVLNGTGTRVDGTIMATPNDARPFSAQTAANLRALNERRAALGLEAIYVKTQSAANVDTFTGMKIGTFFQLLSKHSRRMIGRYVKIDDERVQDIGDGRQWLAGYTEIPGNHVDIYIEPWSTVERAG